MVRSMDSSNQPTDQSQPHTYSIDYLDQIAPKGPQSSGPKKIVLILAGGVLLLLIILVMTMVLSSGPKSSGQTAIDLQARLETLKTVAKEHQPKLRDNVLRNYNSALTLQLTNASTDLKTALEAEGVKVDKVSDKQKAEQLELLDELKLEFEEAELNIQLDRIYAREMTYQLDVIGSMITAIANKPSNELIKDFIKNNASNLKAIAKNLNTFDGAK